MNINLPFLSIAYCCGSEVRCSCTRNGCITCLSFLKKCHIVISNTEGNGNYLDGKWTQMAYTIATGNCCIEAKICILVSYVEVLQSTKFCVKWLWFVSMFYFFTGTIKSCILIENILLPYEMQAMSYTLRKHCVVLSCGSGDYAFSIITIYGFGLYKNYYHVSHSFLSLFYIHSHILFNFTTSLCVCL